MGCISIFACVEILKIPSGFRLHCITQSTKTQPDHLYCPTRTPKPARGTKTTKSARNSHSTSWSRKVVRVISPTRAFL